MLNFGDGPLTLRPWKPVPSSHIALFTLLHVHKSDRPELSGHKIVSIFSLMELKVTLRTGVVFPTSSISIIFISVLKVQKPIRPFGGREQVIATVVEV